MRCAIGPIVCDLPVGRKLLQLAAVTSNNYCSVCTLAHKHTWGHSDYPWEKRDVRTLRNAAEEWKNASTIALAKQTFDQFGVCFGELWRLSYLDLTIQLTVDPMHCLLEGLVMRHFRGILHLTSRRQAGAVEPAILYQFCPVPDTLTNWSDNDKKHVLKLHKILREPLDGRENLIKKLNSCNKTPLEFVCGDLNIRPLVQGRLLKADWAEVLADWVSK